VRVGAIRKDDRREVLHELWCPPWTRRSGSLPTARGSNDEAPTEAGPNATVQRASPRFHSASPPGTPQFAPTGIYRVQPRCICTQTRHRAFSEPPGLASPLRNATQRLWSQRICQVGYSWHHDAAAWVDLCCAPYCGSKRTVSRTWIETRIY
jgi:hypothetical protein